MTRSPACSSVGTNCVDTAWGKQSMTTSARPASDAGSISSTGSSIRPTNSGNTS